MRSGLHVFTHRHYPSRIRGGHTYVELQVGDESVESRANEYDFLLSLGDSYARSEQEGAIYGDEELKPLVEQFDDLREGGIIVYDTGQFDEEDVAETDLEELAEENDWHVYPVDLRGIAQEHGRAVMRNTAGLGVTAALVDQDLASLEELIEENMSGEMAEQNLEVLHEAYEQAQEFEADHDVTMPTGEHDGEQALLTGSDGIAYGALDSGCRFISGYPMTPWTDVFRIMSQHLADFGGIAEQVEDEVASATLALGASHAGVKAMSGSSGGGFALMTEALGLAEMTETPVVYVEATRAGPSTGMPTKTEQGDLEHVLYSSQGDSCRVVFAPANAKEAYEQTRQAFDLAYDYQMPALVIYDQKLEGELRSVPIDFFDRDPNPDMGEVLTEEELEEAARDAAGKFERFQRDPDTDKTGVSPRSIPGQKDGRFLTSGNETAPSGHISEDPVNRKIQMDRRMSKMEGVHEELAEGETNQTVAGDEDADLGILTYGSTQDTVFEAVDHLAEDGHSVKAMGVSDLMPFATEEVTEFLESVDEALVVEMNASGQFHALIQRELGKYGDRMSQLLKYNGEPFRSAEIIEAVEERIDGGQPAAQNVTFVPTAGD
jgi:pyruvate ferredoxin oxidoreductase alpha subunit